MKSASTIAAFALAATASARPSSRLTARDSSVCIVPGQLNPMTPQIALAIDQWSKDVDAVNAFLNQAWTLDANSLTSSASAVLPNLQDELCQLGTLNSVLSGAGSDAATCALNELPNMYATLEFTVNQIIAAPSDQSSVQAALEDIDAYRCCHVLPDLDILWADAAGAVGIKGQTPSAAGRENMCAEVDCSAYLSYGNQCSTKYNNGLGK